MSDSSVVLRTKDIKADERSAPLDLWPPLILSMVLLWVVPMGHSLGLDESGNWWVIKDGFSKMIERSRFWPGGESILFDLLVLAARSVGGNSDFVMRIPSLVMSMLALFFIFRLGRRLAGSLAAMWSCLAFVIMPDVIYVASTVRPYALALALVTGAMLALVIWLDTGEFRYGLAYALLSALTVFAAITYAIMFAVHAVYVIVRLRAGTSTVRPVALIGAWSISGLLLIPRAADVLRLYRERLAHSYVASPMADQMLASIVPLALAASVGLAVMIALLLRWPVFLSVSLTADAWWLALWAIMPPGILVLASLIANVHMFAPRYYLANAPAIALVSGMILSQFKPAEFRRLLAGTMAVSLIMIHGINENFSLLRHDFRGAVEYMQQWASPDTPVLLVSGFVESERLANIQNPAFSEVLIAPFLRYHVPGQITILPSVIDIDSLAYVEQLSDAKLRNKPRFLLAGMLGSDAYLGWLTDRATALGYSIRATGAQGGLRITVFDRSTK